MDPWDPTVITDLQKQGHTTDSVPHQGERVLVSRFANPSVDVTDEVHPSVAEHVIIAAKAAGLDICGIDVVCRDISKPLTDQGGAVVEINASPGLHIHLQPAVGKGRPVGEDIMAMLFPDGKDGRIPIIGVTGTRGKTTTVGILAHLIRATGKLVGVASSDGILFGERLAKTKDGDRIGGSQGVLLHPWTEIAICEASTEQIIADGLGFDRCSVGIVLNVRSEDIGHAYIDALEQLAKVNRCVVDVVLPTGTAVLNADDEFVSAMAQHSKGSVIFFTSDPSNEIVVEHRGKGGRAVILRDGVIQLTEGEMERALCALTDVSLPTTGHFTFHIEDLLAAVGGAWAFGLDDETIVVRLRSFTREH
jgi:cyanophycin synthetase